MIDDAAQEHGLSLPRVALDPEQLLVSVVAPLAEVRVIEQPDVTVAKQTALGLLDALLIEARVTRRSERYGFAVGCMLMILP